MILFSWVVEMKSKNINLRIDEDKLKLLEEEAKKEETSVSAIIRKAINNYLKSK